MWLPSIRPPLRYGLRVLRVVLVKHFVRRKDINSQLLFMLSQRDMQGHLVLHISFICVNVFPL